MDMFPVGERYAARLRRIRATEAAVKKNQEVRRLAGVPEFSVGAACSSDTPDQWTGPPGVGRVDCCPVNPPQCDCHLVAGNTLSVAAGVDNTIAAGAAGNVTIDSGDAGYFIPYYMSVVALESLAANQVNPATILMVLLIQSLSGQVANMRRQSPNDPGVGVHNLAYAEHKQVECVDWHAFSSQQNQELVLTFFNPTEVAAHVFVDIWGLPKRKLGT